MLDGSNKFDVRMGPVALTVNEMCKIDLNGLLPFLSTYTCTKWKVLRTDQQLEETPYPIWPLPGIPDAGYVEYEGFMVCRHQLFVVFYVEAMVREDELPDKPLFRRLAGHLRKRAAG